MHDDHMPGDDPLPLPDPWAVRDYHPLNPFGWMDRAMTRWAKLTVDDEKAYVANPSRLRRLFRWDIGTFIAVIVLTIVEGFTREGTWLNTMILPCIGFIVGRALLWRITRARAYRNGWLDGRRAMFASMSEAMTRGLTIEEWAEGEMERDMEVLRYL